MFRDLDAESGLHQYEIQVADFDLVPAIRDEDAELPTVSMDDYETRRVPLHGIDVDMTPEMVEYADDPFKTFETTFVHSFTKPIYGEVTERVPRQDLDYQTPNEILFEATLDGREAVMRATHGDPDAILVADNVAETIVDDSIFEEWEPIARDIEQGFGIDVLRDKYDALPGNEVLVADRDRMGYEIHSTELHVEDRISALTARALMGYAVIEGEAAVRIAV